MNTTRINAIRTLMQEYSASTRVPNTDKASFHAYEEFYPTILDQYVDGPCTLLEVGVAGGVSLHMWKEILPQATIYGADQNYGHLKYLMEDFKDTFFLREGSQTDSSIFQDLPMMDIIIDDASHVASLTMQTYAILKSKVKPGGIYVIEDVWEDQLKEYTPEFLQEFECLDLRPVKQRVDDMLLVFRNPS